MQFKAWPCQVRWKLRQLGWVSCEFVSERNVCLGITVMILEVRQPRGALSEAERLAASATAQLRRSEYRKVRNVVCEAEGDQIVILGKVPSFYHKQLAQSWLIQHATGCLGIENKLEIVDSHL